MDECIEVMHNKFPFPKLNKSEIMYIWNSTKERIQSQIIYIYLFFFHWCFLEQEFRDLQILKAEMAQDVDALVGVVQDRVSRTWDQFLDLAWPLWRIGVRLLQLCDEVTVEVLGIYDRIFHVVVDLRERMRERMPTLGH